MISTIIKHKLRTRANFHKIVYPIIEQEIIIPQLYNDRYNGANPFSIASKLLQNEIAIQIKELIIQLNDQVCYKVVTTLTL